MKYIADGNKVYLTETYYTGTASAPKFQEHRFLCWEYKTEEEAAKAAQDKNERT